MPAGYELGNQLMLALTDEAFVGKLVLWIETHNTEGLGGRELTRLIGFGESEGKSLRFSSPKSTYIRDQQQRFLICGTYYSGQGHRVVMGAVLITPYPAIAPQAINNRRAVYVYQTP